MNSAYVSYKRFWATVLAAGPTAEQLQAAQAISPPRPLWLPKNFLQNSPQARAYESEADVLGYGGAAGGGKSDLLLGLAATEHRRSLILRKEAVQLRALVDRSREILGGLPGARLNENTGTWRGLPDGRQVEFGGVANPGDEQKYRGRPHDLLGFDEGDQFPEFVFRFLCGWLRTTDPGQRCRVVIGFNPPATAEGRWLLEYFRPWMAYLFPGTFSHARPAAPGELRWYATLPDGREVERDGPGPFADGGDVITPRSRTFIPAKVEDNPDLMRTGYRGTLQALPEPLRSQLLYGDMRAGLQDDAWQVIPSAWARAAQARWEDGPPAGQGLTALSADVAYGGAAATCVARQHGPWVGRLKSRRGSDTDSGEKNAFFILEGHDGKAPVFVDVVGYGATTYEALRGKIGRLAVPVSGSEPTEQYDRSRKYRLVNVRACGWWRLREALDPEAGDGLMLPPDPELLADLTAPRYEVTAQGIKVEEKKKVIERLGRSPDAGDAVAQLFAVPEKRRIIFGV